MSNWSEANDMLKSISGAGELLSKADTEREKAIKRTRARMGLKGDKKRAGQKQRDRQKADAARKEAVQKEYETRTDAAKEKARAEREERRDRWEPARMSDALTDASTGVRGESKESVKSRERKAKKGKPADPRQTNVDNPLANLSKEQLADLGYNKEKVRKKKGLKLKPWSTDPKDATPKLALSDPRAGDADKEDSKEAPANSLLRPLTE